MQIDVTLLEKDLRRAGELAGAAERSGHHGVWATESGADPFLQAYSAISATDSCTVGTAIAVALARTPMTVAYSAWNLADVSGGRFVLGLGSQVKAHVERRYSMLWDKPVTQMREFILATRAIFDSWREGTPLQHEGEYYTHTLMSPFWAPSPHDHDIPIHLAAVGPRMVQTAGEVADGLLLHAFVNRAYLEEVTYPALDAGLAASGRQASDVSLSLPMFMIMGDDEQEIEARRKLAVKQLAFYGSTPSYRPVLDAVGFGDVQPELTRLSKAGAWDDLSALVSDELLGHFSITGKPEAMPALAREHLGGRIDRTTSYFGWPVSDPDRLKDILQDFNQKEGSA